MLFGQRYKKVSESYSDKECEVLGNGKTVNNDSGRGNIENFFKEVKNELLWLLF